MRQGLRLALIPLFVAATLPARAESPPNAQVVSVLAGSIRVQQPFLSCSFRGGASATYTLPGPIDWVYSVTSQCNPAASSLKSEVEMVLNGLQVVNAAEPGRCQNCERLTVGNAFAYPTAAGSWKLSGETTIEYPGLGLLFGLGLYTITMQAGTTRCAVLDPNAVRCTYETNPITIP